MRERWLAVPLMTLVPWMAACEMEPPTEQELTDEDRQAIEALADQYTEFTLAQDWDSWADLFHEDAVRMPQDAPPSEGRNAIRDAAPPEEGVTITEFSAQSDEVEGTGDLAFSRGSYTVVVTQQVDDEEMEMEEEGNYFIVVRRSQEDPGQWLIYREMFNRNHPPELPQAEEPDA